MNFRTINDLNNLINQKIHLIPDDIDLIVGIPRSGMLPANLISLYKNLPLTDLDSFLDNRIYQSGITKKRADWISCIDEARKILFVEDSSASGNSIRRVKDKMVSNRYKDKVVYLAVYVVRECRKDVDLWFEICPTPRMFEWNYMHNGANACFDLDGVLCPDPSEEENDDGDKYYTFLQTAPLRIYPTNGIGTIVTCRLEKYRRETEKWLNEHHISYDKLIMMQYKTKEERIAAGSHGKYKGEIYRSIKDSCIFIESDSVQAKEIAKISGKTVFCVSTQTVYDETTMNAVKQHIKNGGHKKIVSVAKKILPAGMIAKLKKGSSHSG